MQHADAYRSLFVSFTQLNSIQLYRSLRFDGCLARTPTAEAYSISLCFGCVHNPYKCFWFRIRRLVAYMLCVVGVFVRVSHPRTMRRHQFNAKYPFSSNESNQMNIFNRRMDNLKYTWKKLLKIMNDFLGGEIQPKQRREGVKNWKASVCQTTTSLNHFRLTLKEGCAANKRHGFSMLSTE